MVQGNIAFFVCFSSSLKHKYMTAISHQMQFTYVGLDALNSSSLTDL